MTIIFKCKHCSQMLQTDSYASFFSFRCPTCKHIVTVPKDSEIDCPIKYVDPRDIVFPPAPKVRDNPIPYTPSLDSHEEIKRYYSEDED